MSVDQRNWRHFCRLTHVSFGADISEAKREPLCGTDSNNTTHRFEWVACETCLVLLDVLLERGALHSDDGVYFVVNTKPEEIDRLTAAAAPGPRTRVDATS